MKSKDSGGGKRKVCRCAILEIGGRVAQLVEQCPFKAWVDGSSPSALTSSEILGSISRSFLGIRCAHSEESGSRPKTASLTKGSR
jgi:hypothetical protein